MWSAGVERKLTAQCTDWAALTCRELVRTYSRYLCTRPLAVLPGATLRASSALPASDPPASRVRSCAGLAATAADTCREPRQGLTGWQADGRWRAWPPSHLPVGRQMCCIFSCMAPLSLQNSEQAL